MEYPCALILENFKETIKWRNKTQSLDMVASIPVFSPIFAHETIVLQPARGYRPGLPLGPTVVPIYGGEMAEKEK